MKILTAITYYYPHWTGLTAYAQRLAEGLVTRGHQVTVLTSRYRKDLARQGAPGNAGSSENGKSWPISMPCATSSRCPVVPTASPASRSRP
ncbi:MAG: hypothetical protein E3J25_12655 [Anaerolineales bacterium]|nr:MAG: hypothetical protein E3J25_12655 [Anaerolineales bacterium]